MDDFYKTLLINSKQMIEDIREEKLMNKEHIDIEYLAFAALLMYYDTSLIHVFDEIFSNTNIIYIDEEIGEFIGKKYNLNEEQIEKVREHAPYSFYDSTLTKSKKRMQLERTIYVNYNEDVEPCLILRDLIHQLNHVINSYEDPIIERNGEMYSRMGFSFDKLKDRKVTGLLLEEALNKIETKEICDCVGYLTTMDISDESIRKDLDKYTGISDILEEEYEQTENRIADIIEPLFENDELVQKLIESRIDANIFPVINFFDKTMGKHSFECLLQNLNKIDNPKYDIEAQEEASTIAKTLIKKYNDETLQK